MKGGVADEFNADAGFGGLAGSVVVHPRRVLVSIERCRSYGPPMPFGHLGLGGE